MSDRRGGRGRAPPRRGCGERALGFGRAVSPAARRPPFVVFFSIVGAQTRTTTNSHHDVHTSPFSTRLQSPLGELPGGAPLCQPAPPAGGTVMQYWSLMRHRIIGRFLSSSKEARASEDSPTLISLTQADKKTTATATGNTALRGVKSLRWD